MMKNYKEKRIEAIKKLLPKPVSGKGLINSLINNLPFEAHPPSYRFLGPGTKLEERLARGDKPLNKLDALARDHDIAYHENKDLKTRHDADYRLQEQAWHRVLDPKASLGERSMAYITTNLMKAKRKLGAGVRKNKSTQYIAHPVNLLEIDKMGIISASERRKPIEIELNLGRTKDSVMNETSLPLTFYQIKKLKKARKEGKSKIKLKLSAKQVQHYKQGGFLPMLLAAAPAVAALGALGNSVYNSYQNKKNNDRLFEEQVRHNKVLEGRGLSENRRARKSRGTGVIMNRKPPTKSGNGLLEELLKKKKKKTPLSNLDLLAYAKELGITNFRGVFMRDNLPKSGPRKNECGIVNLDSSKGSGTHWVAYRVENSSRLVRYYDSFGLPPPIELQQYFINSVLVFSCEQQQQVQEVTCGHLCLKFLFETNN